jgi:hypothetical protein
LVPVKNGAMPEAPEGGHSNQAGTLFELAAADDPPELGGADGAAAADVLGAAAAPGPPEEEGAAAVLLGAAAAVDGATIAPGNVTAPYGFARVVPAIPEV